MQTILTLLGLALGMGAFELFDLFLVVPGHHALTILVLLLELGEPSAGKAFGLLHFLAVPSFEIPEGLSGILPGLPEEILRLRPGIVETLFEHPD